MTGNKRVLAATLSFAALLGAAPAFATTNLILNGSFETGDFTDFAHLNANVSDNQPAQVIAYNQTTSYPTGAFGESVPAANAPTDSPDAAGSYAAYFVSDHATNESIQQLTYLRPGNYELGFSAYLTYNGYANPVDASLSATIIGVPVATFIASEEGAGTWASYSGVAEITKAGYYNTDFVFNSNGYPAKDFVIDQVYATATNKPFTVIIPPTPTVVPEPASWALMMIGFGGLGALMRRGRSVALTA